MCARASAPGSTPPATTPSSRTKAASTTTCSTTCAPVNCSNEMDSSLPDRSVLIQRAETLYELGRYREAIVLLNGLLARDPEDAYVLCALAANLLNLKETGKALEYAERAIAANPDQEWGHRL